MRLFLAWCLPHFAGLIWLFLAIDWLRLSSYEGVNLVFFTSFLESNTEMAFLTGPPRDDPFRSCRLAPFKLQLAHQSQFTYVLRRFLFLGIGHRPHPLDRSRLGRVRHRCGPDERPVFDAD